ncbi:MAG: PAS domain S-box protein [Elusimicrobia bacterium]|nr:PAS domain S-box protein [Elusimicrobiota bacterium]
METMEKMMQETSVPVVIADHQGFIIQVNRCFEIVFGWKEKEVLGKPLTVIIPKTLHDSHHLGFSRFLTTGKPTLLNQFLKLKAVTKDGKEFDAEHFILAEERQGQWIFGATIRPLG